MVTEVMGMAEMVQGMKRLTREEGPGQSPWEQDLVNGPQGGSSGRSGRSETRRRKRRCRDAAAQRREGFSMAGWLSVLAAEVSVGPEGS